MHWKRFLRRLVSKGMVKFGMVKPFESKGEIAEALGWCTIEQAEDFCRRNNIDISGLPDHRQSKDHTKRAG